MKYVKSTIGENLGCPAHSLATEDQQFELD